jgi:hypothetical protein
MAISNTGFIGRKDLLATARDIHPSAIRSKTRKHVPFRRIICAFPFQTVRMSDIILVLLVELVVRYVTERLSPECNSLVDRETQNL